MKKTEVVTNVKQLKGLQTDGCEDFSPLYAPCGASGRLDVSLRREKIETLWVGLGERKEREW